LFRVDLSGSGGGGGGGVGMDAGEARALLGAVREVMAQDTAREYFNEPVDVEALGIPDYVGVVQRPMDLGTVARNLQRVLDDDAAGSGVGGILKQEGSGGEAGGGGLAGGGEGGGGGLGDGGRGGGDGGDAGAGGGVGGGPGSSPLAAVAVRYPSLAAALVDVRQVWRNCKRYNAHPSHAPLRTACDRLHAMLLASLRRAGVTPPRAPELTAAGAHPDAEVHEDDVPEAFGTYLPGEDLTYRMLDGFVVCRADDVGTLEAGPYTRPLLSST
jgi:hypothetical protein